MSRKLSITVVVGLLLCSLTVLEFPELVNLVDDTSNNFTFLTSPGEMAISSVEQAAPEEHKSAVTRNQERSSLMLLRFAAASKDSNSLLRFLCIRRT
ncbi:MAG TPA: hypothetical protein VNE63_05050 [Candidatus Acidoferrales bacterium]|nr:hypothetical protein [Candidatus Acidoferrales bacterium]